MAGMVPFVPAPRYRRIAAHARRSAGEGALLGALRATTVERTPGKVAERTTRWLRGQAHDIKIRQAHEVLAGHRLPRHLGSGRARRPGQRRRWRAQHQLLARHIALDYCNYECNLS